MNKFIFIFLAVFSTSVTANWKHYLQPVELLFEGRDSGSRVYIVFAQKFPTDGCSQDGHYIRIYGDTKKGEYQISTLLTAIAANKHVSPAISGCDDWGRPVLLGIRINSGG